MLANAVLANAVLVAGALGPLAIPFPQFDPAIVTLPGFSVFGLDLGPFPIRWYALAYIAGLVLGWLYVARVFARPRLWGAGGAPIASDAAADLFVWMTLGVVIGGRLGFVLFYRTELLWTDPLAILRLWEGGMAFHGGFLGVVIGVWLFARAQGASALRIGDAVACAAPIGIFFGRIANFVNGELWGRPTDAPWGMVFPQVEQLAERYPWLLVDGVNVARHPSQLYEAALEGLLLLAVLGWAAWRGGALARPGLCCGLFLAGYGLGRFTVEFFRQWNVELGFDLELFGVGFSRGQTLSVPMIVVGALLIRHALRRPVAAVG